MATEAGLAAGVAPWAARPLVAAPLWEPLAAAPAAVVAMAVARAVTVAASVARAESPSVAAARSPQKAAAPGQCPLLLLP